MDEWYEELDFEENPFSTNPSDFLKNIVGRDEIIDDIMYRVRAGSLVFLEGEDGNGKTSLLRLIIKKFRGKGRVIYVNCEKFERTLNIEELLIQRNGIIKGLLMNKKPKNMILLLDNVSKLSYKNMERIKYYFDQNYLKSVVFTGESFEKVDFSKSLVQRIEGRVIKIPKMESYQVVDMIRERIGDISFFSDEIIEKIADISNHNPRAILKNSEEVAEFVVGIDEEIVTEKHVEEVLKKSSSKEIEKASETNKEEPKKDEKEFETPIIVSESDSESSQENSNEEPVKEDKVEVYDADIIEEEKDIPINEKETKEKDLSDKEEEKNQKKEVKKSDTSEKNKETEDDCAEVTEDKTNDSKEEEASAEDILSKPIISEELEDSKKESKKEKEKSLDDEDDFFADDFFDDFEDDGSSEIVQDSDDEEEVVTKKKTKSSGDDFDDFFDDDFDK